MVVEAFFEGYEATRWKEIVEPSQGRFMHHLELHGVGNIDDEVRRWLEEAYANGELYGCKIE